jgi:membrane-bound lytic murein transglycosylase B
VFDRETRGLEPDYKLPDLLLPGRPKTGAPAQAEFVQVPADYVKEASIARLAARGRTLMEQHAATLKAIEQRFGVPGTIILAIWGRETDYGRYALPYDGLRVLATQAYVGRRKDQYRGEFIEALKLIQNGDVTRRICARHGAARRASRNSCRRNCPSTASISMAMVTSTSGPPCRMHWRPPRSSSRTRVGAGPALGL